MTNEQICERLNEILANELAGAMMYLHYSFYIYGHARIPIVGWLRGQSTEGMQHATLVGDKIIKYGGDPVTEPSKGMFPPKFDSLDDMLRTSLDLEKKVFGQYESLLNEIENQDVSLRLFLEAQLTEESGHIDEIEKMLLPDVVK
jgi:bacterioferritin